jgi:tetratricopeptide (TPR) repeat protein
MLFAFSLCTGAFAQERLWEELIASYKSMREQTQTQHDYSKTFEAIDIANKALQVAEKQFGPNNPRVAESLYYAADAYNFGMDYAHAEPLYRQALAVYEEAQQQNTFAYAKVLIGLSTLYAMQSKFDQALVHYQRALATIEKLPKPDTI